MSTMVVRAVMSAPTNLMFWYNELQSMYRCRDYVAILSHRLSVIDGHRGNAQAWLDKLKFSVTPCSSTMLPPLISPFPRVDALLSRS